MPMACPKATTTDMTLTQVDVPHELGLSRLDPGQREPGMWAGDGRKGTADSGLATVWGARGQREAGAMLAGETWEVTFRRRWA